MADVENTVPETREEAWHLYLHAQYIKEWGTEEYGKLVKKLTIFICMIALVFHILFGEKVIWLVAVGYLVFSGFYYLKICRYWNKVINLQKSYYDGFLNEESNGESNGENDG